MTLSSDGYLFGYIGKATWVSTTQPGTSTVNSNGGFSTYTITWPGDIIVAVAVSGFSGSGTYLRSQSQSGSTWTITVFNTTTSTGSLGFATQVATDVYVWGVPTTPSTYGLALYDSAGNLTGDLSRTPLIFKDRVSFSSSDTSKTTSSYTKPAIIGSARMLQQTATNIGGSVPWRNLTYEGVWQWDSGTLYRSFAQTRYNRDDGPGPVSSVTGDASVLLLEASALT